jgi:glycosyltransferase involved in cell wall biosynthesis
MEKYKNYLFVLPVYNEEYRIKRTLDYYSKFLRILVVDNFSEDRTLSIVKESNINFIQIKNQGSTQTQEWFEELLEYIQEEEYILIGSVSHFFNVSFLALCDKYASEKKVAMIRQSIETYTCGEHTLIYNHLLTGNNRFAEVFLKKDEVLTNEIYMHLPFKVSEQAEVIELHDSKYNIMHLRDSDALTLVKKCSEYAFVEAQQIMAKDLNFNIIKLIKNICLEVFRLVRFPKEILNKSSIREVWARVFWLSLIYWIVWEQKTNNTIKDSEHKSQKLWDFLVRKNDFINEKEGENNVN